MKRVPWLPREHCVFPDIDEALEEPNGLLAAGGDLTPEWLLLAYQTGAFPWYDDEQPILWWSPDPRCVIEPSSFVPSRSLAKRLRRRDYEVHIDRDFRSVIRLCSERPSTKGDLDDSPDDTWITPEMMQAYIELHEAGFAHSVECYIEGRLAGGLYGVSLGNLFFGESMFHRETDASKIAFAHLMKLMASEGSDMVDCQITNPHLQSLGAIEIPREAFRQKLQDGLAAPDIDWQSLAGKVNLEI